MFFVCAPVRETKRPLRRGPGIGAKKMAAAGVDPATCSLGGYKQQPQKPLKTTVFTVFP